MSAHIFSQLILYFAFYSFFGWFCETFWDFLHTRKFRKGGFFIGPYRPVYGFGAIILLIYVLPLKENPFLVFIVSVAITTILEYFTGWLLENLFHKRWWDYSSKKFQIKGRICLLNSTLFGLLGLFMVYVMQPAAEKFVNDIHPYLQIILSTSLFFIYIYDLIRTLNILKQEVKKQSIPENIQSGLSKTKNGPS